MDYAKAYTEIHAKRDKSFAGMSLLPHVPAIIELVSRTRAQRLLDYGCQLPDARVLTPTGWRAIGDLRVGDAVIGASGDATQVTGTHSPGTVPIFRVCFNDNTSIVVDGNHLWAVRTINHQNRSQPFVVKKTSELAADIGWGKDGHANKWRIPMVQPVAFNYPGVRAVDPYLLGLLLGDGHFAKGSPRLFTIRDEMVDAARRLLPKGMEVREITGHSGGSRCFAFIQPNGNRWLENPIKQELKRVGLFGARAWEKFLPKDYLLAPIEDRVSLLQGLIDTDGEVTDYGLSYSTASERLADDLSFLVQSLGGTVTRSTRDEPKYPYKGEVCIGRCSFRLQIKLPPSIRPTRIKSWRVRESYHPNRIIVEIEEVGLSHVVGISVAAPDQLYITESCIVTHNCGKGMQYLSKRAHEAWGGILPVCYDVGVPLLSARPQGQFDGVVCTDVMEHIETADVPAVLEDLFSFVATHPSGPKAFAFFSICCKPAKHKTLPDGRNVHLTVKPPGWWNTKLLRHDRENLLIQAVYIE